MRRFLIILIIILLAEIYSFLLIRSVTRSLPQGWRNMVLITYGLLSVFSWASLLSIRTFNWSQVPHGLRNVIIVFVMGFLISKIIVMLIMLIDDLRRLVLLLIHSFAPAKEVAADAVTGSGTGISRSLFMKRLALIMGGIVLGGSFLGMRNRYNYRIRKVSLSFPNLPEAFRGMKMIQVSDIHSGSFDSHEAVLHGVEKIMAEKADLIVFTGDLVNNQADEILPYTDIFSRLKAPLGVYSTLGNHDYGDYVQWPSQAAKEANLEQLKKAHADMGWRLLMNEHAVLQKEGQSIALIGVENWSAKAQFPKHGKLKEAYAGLQEQHIPFKILMSHDPSHWDAEVRPQYPDIDLTLSGHTHGMQFGIEIPGFKWSPVQYMYKQWAGLYQEAKQYLYVNRGFGFLGYPGRMGILAEITVFEFS